MRDLPGKPRCAHKRIREYDLCKSHRIHSAVRCGTMGVQRVMPKAQPHISPPTVTTELVLHWSRPPQPLILLTISLSATSLGPSFAMSKTSGYAEWEPHKAQIEQIYLHEGKTQRELNLIMDKTYGFRKTYRVPLSCYLSDYSIVNNFQKTPIWESIRAMELQEVPNDTGEVEVRQTSQRKKKAREWQGKWGVHLWHSLSI